MVSDEKLGIDLTGDSMGVFIALFLLSNSLYLDFQ
jgi:hypothetical protein